MKNSPITRTSTGSESHQAGSGQRDGICWEEVMWYLVWPYQRIRSRSELIGSCLNIVLQVLTGIDRASKGLDRIDSFGWFPEWVWLEVNIILIVVQMLLIVRYYEGAGPTEPDSKEQGK